MKWAFVAVLCGGLRSGGSELGRGYPIGKGRGIETRMAARKV